MDVDEVRLLMKAAPVTIHETEMFNGIRDIKTRSLEADLTQSLVKQGTGRTDKGATGEIFLITRLLPDQHDFRIKSAFPEDRPCADVTKFTGCAINSVCPQLRETTFTIRFRPACQTLLMNFSWRVGDERGDGFNRQTKLGKLRPIP